MCQSAPTSSPLQQSSALHQMWSLQPGRGPGGQRGCNMDAERREGGLERAHWSWRMRPVFHRQAWFCPRVVIRPHKHFINSLFKHAKRRRTHTNTLTRERSEADGPRENKDPKKRKIEGLPQLFGVVLLNLRPLFHKLYILFHQLQARLCVLLNDVILVLGKEAWQTNKEKKASSQRSAGNGTCIKLLANMWDASLVEF